MEALAQFVSEVSDPANPKYGQYMTNDEVNAFTAPLASDMAAIRSWLNPICRTLEVDTQQGTFACETDVATASLSLATTFTNVVHVHSGKTIVRAGDYSVPEDVNDAIDAIFGLHGLPLPTKPQQQRSQAAPAVTPAVLAEAYEIKGVKPTGGTKNRMAVAEFQGQFMNTSDLTAFFKLYLPDSPASDSTVYKFHGLTQNGDGIEAQLDIQFIMGVAPGIKTEFYEQANSDFCADLQNWTGLLLSTDDIPLVHSVSYGWQGNLTQIGCEDAEVAAIDVNYMKVAAKGISIIFASGDSGSGYTAVQPPQPPQCDNKAPGTRQVGYEGEVLQNLTIGIPPTEPLEGPLICCSIARETGVREAFAGWTFSPHTCAPGASCTGSCVLFKTITKTTHASKDWSGKYIAPPPPPPHQPLPILYPSWPASSPYVTSVGATRFHNDVVGGQEEAVNIEDHFGSGGGFSIWKQFPAPDYQTSAIADYFKNVEPSTLPDPTKVDFNKGGRGTPDVAALGTGFSVVNNGVPIPGGVGGTSASAPTFAGIIGLVNEARIQAGKPAMGLLNKFIYANPDVFTDIVLGSDKWGRGGGTLPAGYNCSVGWDPVTGFGTPIFPKLLAAAMAN